MLEMLSKSSKISNRMSFSIKRKSLIAAGTSKWANTMLSVTERHMPMNYFVNDEIVLAPLSKIAGRPDRASKLGKLNSALLVPFHEKMARIKLEGK